jgi:hypothetical protein
VCTIVVDERCGNSSRVTCAANATDGSVVNSSSVAGVDLLSQRAYVLAFSMSRDQDRQPDGGSQLAAASVYGAVVLASAEGDGEPWVDDMAGLASSASSAAGPLYLYLGNNPSVALAPVESAGGSLASVAFLLTFDSGFCPNSETNNKRADLGVCDIFPVTCEGSSVLNYAYGSAQALQQLLQQNLPLSPCHSSVVSLMTILAFIYCVAALTLLGRCSVPWTMAIIPRPPSSCMRTAPSLLWLHFGREILPTRAGAGRAPLLTARWCWTAGR